MITDEYFSALAQLGNIYGEVATVITVTILLLAGGYTIGKIISKLLAKK